MAHSLAFGLLCFSSLFTIIDPLAASPLFVSMTTGQTAQGRRRIALRACGVALGLLLVFAIGGSSILRMFGVTIDAFRIAGGILFVGMALRMLGGHEREKPADTGDHEDDPSVVPLGMPIICGPGAMSTVMVLMGQSTSKLDVAAFFVALITVVAATAAFLLAAPAALRLIGRTGVHVMTQVMGLIVCVIGIQFVIDGVRPVVVDMLSTTR